MRTIHRLVIVAIAILIAAGCSQAEPTVEQGPPTESVAVSPLQSTSPLSPDPDTESDSQGTPPPALKPEKPVKGKGTVVGTLHEHPQGQPYAHQFIYLAPTRQMDSENTGDQVAYFAELDISSDPFAQTDEHGRLLVPDIEPGLYTLVVRLPNLQEILLYDQATSRNLVVEVVADEIYDLGTVNVIIPQ
jgi:hypothetical protein